MSLGGIMKINCVIEQVIHWGARIEATYGEGKTSKLRTGNFVKTSGITCNSPLIFIISPKLMFVHIIPNQ